MREKMNPQTILNSLLFKLMFLISLTMVSVSCGDGSDGRNPSIPGLKGPHVTLHEDNVLISIVFENLNLQGGARYAIPRYTDSYIELSPDLQSNGTLMSISISLQDVFDGNLDQLDPQALPDGRPLPGVAKGKLPAVAFTIEKFRNMSFYIGPKVFGVFVPIKKLPLGNSIATFRFYSSGSRIGNISLVGAEEDSQYEAGALLMLDLSNTVKRRLKRVKNKYN